MSTHKNRKRPKTKAPAEPKSIPTEAAPAERRHQQAPAERWQHGAEREDDELGAIKTQPQRIRTVVATLLANQKIDLPQARAAARWLRDYELGIHHARDPELIGTCSGSPDGIPVAICDALSRQREACHAVGRFGTRVLTAVVFECLTLTALAQRLYPDRVGGEVRQVTGIVVSVLERLTEHYEALDKLRKHQSSAWHERAPAIDRVPEEQRPRPPIYVLDGVEASS